MAASDTNLTNGLQKLQAIAFDVDGVLTDGSLTWSPNGEEPSAVTESKSFTFTDIMGISLLRRLGVKLALISGEASPLVDQYATSRLQSATSQRSSAWSWRRSASSATM